MVLTLPCTADGFVFVFFYTRNLLQVVWKISVLLLFLREPHLSRRLKRNPLFYPRFLPFALGLMPCKSILKIFNFRHHKRAASYKNQIVRRGLFLSFFYGSVDVGNDDSLQSQGGGLLSQSFGIQRPRNIGLKKKISRLDGQQRQTRTRIFIVNHSKNKVQFFIILLQLRRRISNACFI